MTESSTLIANQFIAANPIEFAIYNQEEEKVLYIVDNEADAHPLILELKNASPQTIELSTPDSLQKPKNLQGQELSWNDWKAGKDLYHFQLQFRPGTLSRNGKSSLRNPISRLAALSLGWDMNFDLNDADLTDWVSFLWVGTTQATNLTATLKPVVVTSLEENEDFLKQYGISKNAADRKNLVEKVVDNLKTNARDTFHRLNPGFESIVTPGNNPKFELEQRRNYKIAIPNLSADAGGGARSTRIELNYDYLSYVISGESNRIPPGTRSQFINIINRRGQKYIPLHVGFVGSNTILNDGETENKLTLRITNISKDKPITFARKSESEASQFTLSVDSDDTDQPWILATKSQAVGIQVLVGRVDNVGKINGYDSPNADVEIILESPLERTINTNTRLLVPTEKSAPIRLETLTVRKEASQGSSRISVSQPSMASFSNGDVVYAVLDQSNENSWAVESPGSNDPRIRWIIKFNHNKPVILDPGESLEFQLLNIITSAPVGYTNLYVNYEDIPGYWDGHFVVPIEKSPLVYRGNNVGIGTNAPSAKLHVKGDFLVDKVGISTAPGSEQLKVQGDTAIVGNLSTTTLSATSTSTLTGNVRIGETQPGDNLTYSWPDYGLAINGTVAIGTFSDVNGPWYNHFSVYEGTTSVRQLTASGDISASGNISVGQNLKANGDISVGDIVDQPTGYGRKLYFRGVSDNSDPIWIARFNQANDQTYLRINIGDEGLNGDQLQIGYTDFQDKQWKTKFYVDTNGTYNSSDIRLKTAIATISNSLNLLTQLRGVQFQWKHHSKKTESNQVENFGVVAQEVEQVIPQIVSTDTNGSKFVNYTALIPLLIESVKSQQQQIEKLHTEIDSLKGLIATFLH